MSGETATPRPAPGIERRAPVESSRRPDARRQPARPASGIERQGSFDDISPEYAAFVEKFKPKKTTDDCYTPSALYDAVRDWAVAKYSLQGREIVRPFWPGGDYERFDYPPGCVVLDNPPFSILAKILRFYNRNAIDYFLFAPALTLFSYGQNGKTSFVVACGRMTYENGAQVATSFCTNLGENVIEVCGDLYKIMQAVNRKNKAASAPPPKYAFPPDVVTAAQLHRIASRDINFAVPRGEALFTRRLDAMAGTKTSSIFGGGFILSKRAAAERAAADRAAADRAAADRAAADRAAADRAAAIEWKLSPRELALQEMLDRNIAPASDAAKENEKP